MLKQRQWQWLADHHEAVRRYSRISLASLVSIYAALLVWTDWKSRQPEIPYIPASNFRAKFGCGEKFELYMRTPASNVAIQDARLFLLEWHKTIAFDVELLRQHPECVGALLADTENDPNPHVYLIYDKFKGRVVYRIARISDAVSR